MRYPIRPSHPPTAPFRPGPPGRPTAGRMLWWRLGDSAGQATAEYALVILAAAGLAGLLLAWATSTDGVARLMNAVLDSLLDDIAS